MRNPRCPSTPKLTLAASAALHAAVLVLLAIHGPSFSRSVQGLAMTQGVTVTLVSGYAPADWRQPAASPSAASPDLASMARRFEAAQAAPETAPMAHAGGGAAPGLDALFSLPGEKRSVATRAGVPGDPYALAAVTPSAAREARTPGVELVRRRAEACWKTVPSAGPVTVTIVLGPDGRLAARPTVASTGAPRAREAINAVTKCAPYDGAPAGRYEIDLG